MKHVFISYAREDAMHARRLYNDLKTAGVPVWLDVESLLPGQHWESEIRNAIRDASFFIVILSTQSVSKRGFVQRELKQALDVLEEFPENQIFVIPARLDECIPSHERLHEIQWVDLFPSYTEGFARIKQVIIGNANGSELNAKGYARFVPASANPTKTDLSHIGVKKQSIHISPVQELVLYCPNGGVRSLSFSPDNKLLAVGGWDHSVRVFDLASSSEIMTLLGHDGWVDALSFSPDGRLIASSSWGNKPTHIKLWSVEDGLQVSTLVASHIRHVIFHLAFIDDGKRIVSTSGDGCVDIWDIATGKLTRVVTPSSFSSRNTGGIQFGRISPDGRYMVDDREWVHGAVNGEYLVKLYDLKPMTEIRTLIRISESGDFLSAISPDNKLIALTRWDHSIVIIQDLMSGRELSCFGTAHDQLRLNSFNSYSNLIATGLYETGDRIQTTFRLWDPHTGALVYTTQPEYGANGLWTFSPDNTLFACCAGTGHHSPPIQILRLANVAR